MKGFAAHRRSAITISFIVLMVFLLTECINKESNKPATINDSKSEQFAGSAACANCHKDIYNANIHTAHYLTSRPAAQQYIKGNFEKGKNAFVFNDSVIVAMEKRDTAFYQVEYVNSVEQKNRRFDIVTGSGTKGQSYLNWRSHQLFQLPITYFTAEDQWSNSPGYPDKVVFNRPVTSRCLECHTTFIQKTSAPDQESEVFAENSLIYGVDCEKCHGPAAMHVQYQSQNPKETTGRFIINPAVFSRKQKLDMCALCHGGRLSKTKPSFQFQAGDLLSDYFSIDTSLKDANNIDVHGNQYGLLAASECFKKSEMTCNSCHNAHENERGKTALFSQRCMTCHNAEHGNFCKIRTLTRAAIIKNCIDCHMPEQSSKAIAVLLQGAKTPTSATMRTHFIKIYPRETEKVLAMIKETQVKAGSK